MADEVTVHVSLAGIRELIVAAQDCADDLQSEFEVQYQSRNEQPVQMRLFNRDMQVVDRLKRAVQAIDVTLVDPVYRYE